MVLRRLLGVFFPAGSECLCPKDIAYSSFLNWHARLKSHGFYNSAFNLQPIKWGNWVSPGV
jgi:hypothetical protein